MKKFIGSKEERGAFDAHIGYLMDMQQLRESVEEESRSKIRKLQEERDAARRETTEILRRSVADVLYFRFNVPAEASLARLAERSADELEELYNEAKNCASFDGFKS